MDSKSDLVGTIENWMRDHSQDGAFGVRQYAIARDTSNGSVAFGDLTYRFVDKHDTLSAVIADGTTFARISGGEVDSLLNIGGEAPEGWIFKASAISESIELLEISLPDTAYFAVMGPDEL